MARVLLVTVCVTLAALAAGRPSVSGVKTSVKGAQSGYSSGAGITVNTVRGAATAGQQTVERRRTGSVVTSNAANAALGLQAGSAGNGVFSQRGAVTTSSVGGPAGVRSSGAAIHQGAAYNAALTNAVAGGAAANRRLVGVTWVPGVGDIHTRLGLNTGVNVGLSGAVRGTGTFGGTSRVVGVAEHTTKH